MCDFRCPLYTWYLTSKCLAPLPFSLDALIQGGSNMTGTNCNLFTHNQSWSYLNHLVRDTPVSIDNSYTKCMKFKGIHYDIVLISFQCVRYLLK